MDARGTVDGSDARVTPTVDTNEPGSRRTAADLLGQSGQAMDSVGHFARVCKQVLSP